MADLTCSLLIIGAGPGGYVCAIRAAQLGVETIIVESENAGGTCLNVGCIPSKALIHAADEFHRLSLYTSSGRADDSTNPLGISATDASIDLELTQNWKKGIVDRLADGVAGLLKKSGVKSVRGLARFRDGKNVSVTTDTGTLNIKAENIVVATGSEATELARLPFGGAVLSSTEALSLTSLPATLAVVGGGYIGLEIGTAYAKLGSTVTVIESAERILPQYDTSLTLPVEKRLAELGVTVLCQTRAANHDHRSGQLHIEPTTGNTQSVEAEKILLAIGRQARLQGWGLSELSLTTESGFLAIDDRCQTSMRGVYAIGDVTGEPMLAHRAMAQGKMVAEIVAGLPRDWDKVCIPAVCFTDPEIVTAGMSAPQAIAAGIEINASTFPFHANGRALTAESEAGFIQVISREDNHSVVGVQAVGAGIAELSAAFALAIEMGSRLEDIAATVHAHPTLSEGFQEACLAALGQALHI